MIALNNNFGVRPLWAFVAVMENGKKSVVMYPGFGNFMEVLSTGDELGKNVVEDFVISQMGGFALSCVAEMRERKTRKRFEQALILTEDSVFWGGLKEKTQFDGLGKVKRLSTSSAISLQDAYLGLEFKNGASAIAVKNIVRPPAIIAKSGDPAPCMPGETIESFGPPTTNANFPGAYDLMIISAVRLSGGKSALWAYVVKYADHTTETKLLLAEGAGCSDSQSLLLDALSPLKMSNAGTLLLRGKFGEGDAAREGIFILDNPFN